MLALAAVLLLQAAPAAAEAPAPADPRKAECIAVADRETTTEAKIDAYGACMTGGAGGGLAYRPPPKEPVRTSGTSFSIAPPDLPSDKPATDQGTNLLCATSTDEAVRKARGC